MSDYTTNTKLTKEQKEAVGLLSIGTFLEYFDLMLYVHMAVLLNELFFPKTDPHTASLMTAFAFCSTYVLRPFGALIFGWLGDNLGRKATVVITTFMMALSCFVMANLPTYAEIGIAASYIVTLCRIMQGMAAMGEGTGAELYLTETTKPPKRYSIVALVVVFATIGTTAALGVASFVTSFGLNWRLAFWVGAAVALIGTIARTTLRETPDFADAKRRIVRVTKDSDIDHSILEESLMWKEKVNSKTALALFLIQCMWPIVFYFTYIHCGSILKNSFGFTPEQVVHQNFIVSSGQLISYLLLTYLSDKIYPLHILKTKLIIFAIFVLLCPYLLSNITNYFELMLIQLCIVIFAPGDFPGVSIFYIHFPVLKRFTCACLMYALSRGLMSVIVSFGLVYLIESFSHVGILVIMVPVICGYTFGLFHFSKLEKEAGNYPKKKSALACNAS